MTEHPITPPSGLIGQWIKEWQDLRPSFTTLERRLRYWREKEQEEILKRYRLITSI